MRAGNLGLTQLGRVEYALAGGLVYTDAIDNSAGVDCSDHEVNIKILLDEQYADPCPGKYPSPIACATCSEPVNR